MNAEPLPLGWTRRDVAEHNLRKAMTTGDVAELILCAGELLSILDAEKEMDRDRYPH